MQAASTSGQAPAPTPAKATSRAEAEPPGVPGRGEAKRAVVLLRAADVERNVAGRDHVIELGRWLVKNGRPAFTPVEGDIGAAIIALYHAARVVGVHPKIMVIAVRGRDLAEVLAAIDRFPQRQVVDVNSIRVLGASSDMGVIPGAFQQFLFVGHLLPGIPVIIGTI